MDQFKKFDNDLAACKLCLNILSKFYVDPCTCEEIVVPKPIVSGIRKKPIMVIGQTPGLTEYRTGKPFQGQTGKGIRKELAKLGVHDFDRVVFSSAVAKCFAGRKRRKANNPMSKCEDRQPPVAMVKNCRPFLKQQITLVDPSIVITLGSLALKAYLELSGQKVKSPQLKNYVGTSHEWNGRTVIFFPHLSGSSRWLNDYSNKVLLSQAEDILRVALAENKVVNV